MRTVYFFRFAKIFKKYFGHYFYDGDEDLTPEMKTAIKTRTVFTDQMRNVYFKILISKIQDLSKKHKKLVVAQTFIKEKYRLQLIKVIPEAKFILIETKKEIREIPKTEVKEIYDIYYNKGFRGGLLNRIVKHITKNKRLWLSTMLSEEHRIFLS